MKSKITHFLLLVSILVSCILMSTSAAAASKAASANPPFPVWDYKVTNVSGGVKIVWEKSADADGYYILRNQRKDSKYQTIKTITKQSVTSFLDKTAVPGTEYFYAVRAYKKVGNEILESDYDSYGTVNCFLGKPELKAATVISKGVKLQWSESKGADGYIIFKKDSDNKRFTRIATITKSDTLTFVDTDVVKDETYTYRVRGYNEVNDVLFYSSYDSAGKTVKVTRAASSEAPSTGTGSGVTYRALLVGEYKYNHGFPNNDSDLSGPVNDVKALSAALKGLSYSSVKVLRNKGKAAILSAIRTTFANADSNDVSLFYYSGHGVTAPQTDVSGALALPGEKESELFTMEELAEALNQVPGRIVVLLDCCGSGASISDEPYASKSKGSTESQSSSFQPELFNQNAINAFRGRRSYMAPKYGELQVKNKFYVLAAASPWEKSWEGEVYLSNPNEKLTAGAFTLGLVLGAGYNYEDMKFGGFMPADTNNNNNITLEEAYTYTYFKAMNSSKIFTKGRAVQHVMRYPENSKLNIFKLKQS